MDTAAALSSSRVARTQEKTQEDATMEPPATEQNEHENKEEEHPAHAMAPPMSNPREREEPRSMTTIPVCCCDRILRRLPGPISFSSRHTHGESGEDGGAAPPPAARDAATTGHEYHYTSSSLLSLGTGAGDLPRRPTAVGPVLCEYDRMAIPTAAQSGGRSRTNTSRTSAEYCGGGDDDGSTTKITPHETPPVPGCVSILRERAATLPVPGCEITTSTQVISPRESTTTTTTTTTTMTIVRCCYAVVSLVLLVSTLTLAEIEEERSFATTTDQIQTSVGLSIAGGYEIAALHGASIMRGLQQQKVEIDGKMRPAMEAVDYMTGLSGGNLPIVLYSYAQTMDGTEFLDAEGEVTAPQDITAKKLRHIKKGSMFHIFTRRIWLRALPVLLSEKIFKVKSVSVATLVIYYAFIKPLGIKRNQFFGPTELGIHKHFVGVRDDVKATPITNFACTGPQEIYPKNTYDDVSMHTMVGSEAGIFSIEDVETSLSKNGNLTSVLFSATPYEVVSHYDRSMSFDTIAPPNTTVEPLNFPIHPTKPSEWGSKKRRFSLEMLLGTGTNAMGFYQRKFGGHEYNQVREVDVTGNGDMRNLMLEDGGTNAYNPIPSLVQKRVRKIVDVHFNLHPGLSYADIYNISTNLNDWMTKMDLTRGLGEYFGMGSNPIISYAMNLIFDDGLNHMETLRSNLDSLYKADNPLVTTLENITVLDNPFWGTTAGDKVDLTFIMINLPRKFSSKIHRDAAPPPKGITNIVDQNGQFTNKELSTIPNMAALATSKKAIIARGFRFMAFTVRQANMMAYLGSWIVDQAWDKPLLGEDGKEKFGGFKAILEKN